MTTTHVLVNSMDVGQGLGTFVQLFDRDPQPATAPTNTVLVDFGCLGDSEPAGKPRVAWVDAELRKMAQPTIDALYISHGDGDHYNLLPQLLGKFDPYDPTKNKTGPGTLWIRYARYAGDKSDFDIKRDGKPYNVITWIEEFMVANGATQRTATSGTRGGTSFDGLNTVADCTVDNLRCYVVIENVNAATTQLTAPTAFKGGSYGSNTRSMVVLLDFLDHSYQFLSTGDATARTLFECNQVIQHRFPPDDRLANVVGVTVPHHGAAQTLFSMFPRTATEDNSEQVVSEFAARVKPRTVLASASHGSKFKHPHAKVLRYFWEAIRVGNPIWNDPDLGGTHFYTAYFMPNEYSARVYNQQLNAWQIGRWPGQGGFYSVKTPLPMYTNIYYSTTYGGENFAVLPPEPATAVATPANLGFHTGVTWVTKLQRDAVPTIRPLASRVGVFADDYLIPALPVPGVAVRVPRSPGPPRSPLSPAGPPPAGRHRPAAVPVGRRPERPVSVFRGGLPAQRTPDDHPLAPPAPAPTPIAGLDGAAVPVPSPRTSAPRTAQGLRGMAVIL